MSAFARHLLFVITLGVIALGMGSAVIWYSIISVSQPDVALDTDGVYGSTYGVVAYDRVDARTGGKATTTLKMELNDANQKSEFFSALKEDLADLPKETLVNLEISFNARGKNFVFNYYPTSVSSYANGRYERAQSLFETVTAGENGVTPDGYEMTVREEGELTKTVINKKVTGIDWTPIKWNETNAVTERWVNAVTESYQGLKPEPQDIVDVTLDIARPTDSEKFVGFQIRSFIQGEASYKASLDLNFSDVSPIIAQNIDGLHFEDVKWTFMDSRSSLDFSIEDKGDQLQNELNRFVQKQDNNIILVPGFYDIVFRYAHTGEPVAYYESFYVKN